MKIKIINKLKLYEIIRFKFTGAIVRTENCSFYKQLFILVDAVLFLFLFDAAELTIIVCFVFFLSYLFKCFKYYTHVLFLYLVSCLWFYSFIFILSIQLNCLDKIVKCFFSSVKYGFFYFCVFVSFLNMNFIIDDCSMTELIIYFTPN